MINNIFSNIRYTGIQKNTIPQYKPTSQLRKKKHNSINVGDLHCKCKGFENMNEIFPRQDVRGEEGGRLTYMSGEYPYLWYQLNE